MRGFVVLIVLMAASFAASASTIHKLRFAQPATVLVWQDEALKHSNLTTSLGRSGM